MIGENRIEITEGDIVVFPNGITMSYSAWAEQIVVRPPTEHRVRTAVATEGPFNNCIVLEVR